VVINNFNARGIASRPDKAYPPLVIDADAVLALAVALQSLKFVIGRHPQIIEPGCPVQHLQLALRYRPDVHKPGNCLASKHGLGIGAIETSDHECNYIARRVKRQVISIELSGYASLVTGLTLAARHAGEAAAAAKTVGCPVHCLPQVALKHVKAVQLAPGNRTKKS
jgi:hypothetical protein